MTTERIWGLIGAFGLGFILGRVITKKQLNDIHNEELEEREKLEETVKSLKREKTRDETVIDSNSYYPKLISNMEYDLPEPKKIYTVTPKDEEVVQVRNKKDLIYIISTDDFFNETEEESSYDKITLTYYTKDSTLTDDRDELIANPYSILGEPGNNLEFGADPRDPDVIYIRNDKISTDFEILRSEESYVESVLGLDYIEPPLTVPRKRVSKSSGKQATKPKKGAIEDDNI